MIDESLKKYYLALSSHPKIGARTIFKLAQSVKPLSKLWDMNIKELINFGLKKEQITAIYDVVKHIDPDKEWQKLKKNNVKLLIFDEIMYPKLLKQIYDPPAVLYYKGSILPEDDIALAVVGSRKYSDYGKRVTEDIVSKLSRNKITIVSGLALGIDALAHNIALDNKIRTIAVLGCGLDQIYPISNTRLADKILDSKGAIISEFPLGTVAYKSNFPIRNRIIAGLTLGTLVIEGAIDSGSLITAHAALNYDREVFAIPGEIYSETSEGPNRLIQMGAKIVLSENDILNELNIQELNQAKVAQAIIPDTIEEEKLLIEMREPVLVDELTRKVKMSPALVNSTLIMLEMKGMITNLGGTRYVIRGKLQKNNRVI